MDRFVERGVRVVATQASEMDPMSGAVVLGIDPGTAILGFAIVADHGGNLDLVECGTITTTARMGLGERLRALHGGIADVVARHRPTEIAVEKLFFSRNVTSALAVGQARGVAILAAAEKGLTIEEYTPAEIKQAIAQYGNARKEQIQEMVRVLLGLRTIIEPDDAADAAAIAICHHHSRRGRAMQAALVGEQVTPTGIRRRVARG